MKKITYSALVIALAASSAFAKPITPIMAKTVAENFYKRVSSVQLKVSSLAYAYTDANGAPVYYAYNINDNDGFVIISAEDAGKPIIGYSTESHFVVPEAGNQAGYWLDLRVKEIQSARQLNAVADKHTAALWDKLTQVESNAKQNAGVQSIPSATVMVAPLVQTKWNQSPFYNALCPGGSVTGCVATTMSQIMRYWKWPAQGTGSSSYCDCTSSGYKNNYGTLAATYSTTTYNWNNMPLIVSSSNIDVATLNYQAGVSVAMDYDPAGSGAMVLGTGTSPSAQHSYKTYFKYDPTPLKGYNRSVSTTDATWLGYITHDLDIGRPVQYAGYDPNEGGHTWVCDGYSKDDTATYVHMNWGWGGMDDGWFDIHNLQTTNGTFNPSQNHQILVGIVPLATAAIDASISTISSPSGPYCTNNFTPVITLMNAGSTTMTSCDINYQIDGGTVQTINWTGSLVNHQSTTINLPSYVSATGSHTLTCYSSNPNASADGNTANDQSVTVYNVSGADVLPIVEGFESASTLPSWTMIETGTSAPAWATTTSAFATGSTSIMLSNLGNATGNVSSFQTANSYDMTTLTSPVLSFKAAYQETSTSNTDKLQVLTSTDCGASWISRKAITSSALSALSGGASSTAYVPNPSQFTTYTVSLSPVATSTKVMIKWMFTAGSSVGNNVYVDDINIISASTTGISKIENSVGLNIYPNPSSGVVNIAFSLTERQNIAVNVVDMLGRVVETIPAKEYAVGENNITIAQTAYQAGVYFVNMNINGQNVSKKIVIQ